MDKQATLGYILIFLLFIGWLWYSAPKQQEQVLTRTPATAVTTKKDSVQPPVKQEQKDQQNPLGRFFSFDSTKNEKLVTVETDLFIAELTSRGGMIKRWELKKFNKWSGKPVQLIDYKQKGDYSLLFTTSDGRLINTKELQFEFVGIPPTHRTLEGKEEATIEAVLSTTTGGKIYKKFTFRNEEYGFDSEIKLIRMGSIVSNFEYQVVWESGLQYAEHNSVDESGFAGAYVYSGKELTSLETLPLEQKVDTVVSGSVEWVAMRTKYFCLAIIPKSTPSEGAYLEGIMDKAPDNGTVERYGIAVKMPYRGTMEETSSFKVFFGPVDLKILKSYNTNLDQIISLGWTWLIRPISEYVMIPLMSFLRFLIPNWGVVIIVFAFIIFFALRPLTKSSMKSMKKMQSLQPMIKELQEKYKEDPQKMNQQVMNLYKEYGVNPAGSCLPMLLQFPVLIALYNVFRSTIELRQASFVWWINDLSVPDAIFTLPFTIPFFGVKVVSGLALMMGLTMFVQQKMTVKDPRQKAMVYVMPILMTMLFNSFPSGLNLYYFVFNLLSIGSQYLMNRKADEEPLRKVEKKKSKAMGIIGRLGKDMPKFKK
ncbi:MAG: membrane protein insertase YidC [bacterium]